MYVERLVFPQQIVNGVHVHFKPEDWGPIVIKLTREELASIIFYWHKHPDGMAGASQGDEEDTFDTFMDEEAGRKYMGFLQTSANTVGTGFTYDARIELRDPVKVTITDVEIVTDDDVEIQKECEKIIEDHISSGTATASDQPGLYASADKEEEEETTTTTYDENIFDVTSKNGCVVLGISPYFETWMITIFNEAEIAHLLSKYVINRSNEKDGKLEIILHPNKKCVKKLFSFFADIKKEMFYNNSEKDLEASIGNTKLNKTADEKKDDQLDKISDFYK